MENGRARDKTDHPFEMTTQSGEDVTKIAGYPYQQPRLETLLKEWIVPIATLMALLVIAILIIGPQGNFPLNDDWSFAATTRRLAQTGNWLPNGWASMPLITNALWGLPTCLLTTCSFEDLRATTLVAMALLTIATFSLIKLSTARTGFAFVGAVATCFNPIALPLSFSFMTDILFMALSMGSAICFVLAVQHNSARAIILGTLFAIAATLSRQLGLFIPLAFGVICLTAPDRSLKKFAARFAPAAICAASLIAFNAWQKATGRTPAVYSLQSDALVASLKSPAELIVIAKSNIITIVLYTGLFSLPLLCLTRAPIQRKHASILHHLPAIGAVLTTASCALAMIIGHRMMPFGKNYLNTKGVGLPTLNNSAVNLPDLPQLWWQIVSLLSLIGVYFLSYRLTLFMTELYKCRANFEKTEQAKIAAFALIASGIYFAPLLSINIFDRYIIIILPLIYVFIGLTAISAAVGQFRRISGYVILAGTGLFSVLATHDYMSWNRARWTAISDLEVSKIAGPSTLDGGFEYNGMYNYDPSYQPSAERKKSEWWVNRDDYRITFGEATGYAIFKRYSYRTYLPPIERSILILRKTRT